MATPRGNRAVIYVRESLDKWGDERAVERFEQQCRRLCDARGLDVLRTLRDNDVRASNGNHGGGYPEVLRMLRDRQTDYVVIPVVDRFFRSLRDLEDVIDICLETGAALVAASGEIDLSHDQGRLVARLLTSVAKAETERKGARQRDANDQQARTGKRRVGGPRPFGYENDHVTARPAEAGAIRWAADALLGGSSVTAVMREWNRLGLRTAQGGKPFTRQSVTVIMRNPRIAGLAVLPRRPDPGDRPELDNPPRKRKRLLPQEITGRGQWQAILTEEQWRAVTALLGDPARKPPRGAYSLLGGLARCRCGNNVIAGINATGKHIYRCDPQTRRDRPGPHCQQMISYAEPGSGRLTGVDPYVEAVIIERLSRDDIADLLAPPSAVTDTAALHREAAAIRRNLDDLAADRALGLVSRTQMIAATERGNARLAEITADLAASASGSALAPFAAGKAAADVWAGLDRARKRAVLDALCKVIIHPAGRGARMFNPATVELIPREGS